MKTFNQLDAFTQAYITAAFWTNDDDLPNPLGTRTGGMDYRDTGRVRELARLLDESAQAKIEADCAAFQRDHAALLAEAGDDEQNGHDFWLTRNGHGCGFWDRSYQDKIGDGLTTAAHGFGESYIYTGDDGKIYC